MSMNPVAKLHLEMATYKMADTYMVGYTGGCWTFKRAGFYVPQVTGKVKLLNQLNQSEVAVKPLTAGYCLAVLACNRLCWAANNSGNDVMSRFWADQQYKIRDLALETLKGSEIEAFLNFID